MSNVTKTLKKLEDGTLIEETVIINAIDPSVQFFYLVDDIKHNTALKKELIERGSQILLTLGLSNDPEALFATIAASTEEGIKELFEQLKASIPTA